ncbi:MAG: hypothetical protein ACLFTR_00740 [Candidatus Woesearchaeota archaeon]
MAGIIAKDTPLIELTLRKYEKPYFDDKRDLVRKYCLSIGILQPGDSRDVVVDVLFALLMAKKDKRLLSSEEIKEYVIEIRNERKMQLNGVASSNIRRQIKRLRELTLVEKVRNSYRISEFARVEEIFDEKLQRYIIPSILDRLKEYNRKIDEEFT